MIPQLEYAKTHPTFELKLEFLAEICRDESNDQKELSEKIRFGSYRSIFFQCLSTSKSIKKSTLQDWIQDRINTLENSILEHIEFTKLTSNKSEVKTINNEIDRTKHKILAYQTVLELYIK